jgi:KaiC/GvpD/RAD55 family RecA-like ATPase
MFTKVPEELKKLRQWVNWKMLTRANDRPTKVPVHPGGTSASSTDATTWSDFDSVVSAASKFSGIGFVFSPNDPYCGIDFDACRDPKTGAISEWAKPWLKRLDSYSEISPSETGVKVWIKGKLPFESGKKTLLPQYKTGDKTPAIEVYDHARYFAVTGLRYDTRPHEPQERQSVLDDLCAEFFRQTDTTGQQRIDSRLSVIERARKYLDTIPGAVSGSGGHDQTFKAACALVLGFSLTKTEALILMSDYNRRCEPKWTERELRHKVESADKQPGERGYLRDSKDDNWKNIKLPEYKEPEARTTDDSQPKITTLQASVDNYIEKITTSKTNLLSTGIPRVDEAIGGGVDAHEMVIVAARPSHGKSAFALQCLDAAAIMDIPCAIVSEEMSAIALGKRTLQYVTDVREPEWIGKISHVRVDLEQHFSKRAPCYVVEGCGSSSRAVDTLKKLHDAKGVKVAAIDYAQLLTSKGHSRYEQITQTSIALRQLASSTDMTLYVLCQLNRQIEGRDKFIPRLDDIKDTGQLEQDADVILFLVWPYKLDTHKNPELYEVWIGKNRNRPINAGEVDCRFNPSRQQILNPRKTENVAYQPKWNYAND